MCTMLQENHEAESDRHTDPQIGHVVHHPFIWDQTTSPREEVPNVSEVAEHESGVVDDVPDHRFGHPLDQEEPSERLLPSW